MNPSVPRTGHPGGPPRIGAIPTARAGADGVWDHPEEGADMDREMHAVAGDDGMATVEYALVTVAAAGFAGLLVVILKSDEVRGMLVGILRSALGG